MSLTMRTFIVIRFLLLLFECTGDVSVDVYALHFVTYEAIDDSNLNIRFSIQISYLTLPNCYCFCVHILFLENVNASVLNLISSPPYKTCGILSMEGRSIVQ